MPRRRYDAAAMRRDAAMLTRQQTIITNLSQVLKIGQPIEDRARLTVMIRKAENEACRLTKQLSGVRI